MEALGTRLRNLKTSSNSHVSCINAMYMYQCNVHVPYLRNDEHKSGRYEKVCRACRADKAIDRLTFSDKNTTNMLLLLLLLFSR